MYYFLSERAVCVYDHPCCPYIQVSVARGLYGDIISDSDGKVRR